jgi:hypothetical protein
MVTIEELQSKLSKARVELKELERQYIGCTPAQQNTLDLLKKANLTYQWDKRILDTRIAYIEALITKLQNDVYCSEIEY